MLCDKNLLSLFKSSQSQSYLIYSQSKVKAKLIYLQILLFAIEFYHSSPLQRMQNSKCIFVLCLQCRLFLAWCDMSELRLSI